MDLKYLLKFMRVLGIILENKRTEVGIYGLKFLVIPREF